MLGCKPNATGIGEVAGDPVEPKPNPVIFKSFLLSIVLSINSCVGLKNHLVFSSKLAFKYGVGNCNY